MTDTASKEETTFPRTDTLVGDLRDIILSRLRAMPKPWTVMSEAEQQDMIYGVENAARTLVNDAVNLIASNGNPCVRAMVEQAVFKDGLKVVLSASKHDERRHELADAVGASVLVVITDAAKYGGEQSPARPDPDQPDMIGEDDGESDGENVKPFKGRDKE